MELVDQGLLWCGTYGSGFGGVALAEQALKGGVELLN
jgi:hypothetical protein